MDFAAERQGHPASTWRKRGKNACRARCEHRPRSRQGMSSFLFVFYPLFHIVLNMRKHRPALLRKRKLMTNHKTGEKQMPYLERLRTEHMKTGKCDLCGKYQKKLERHHESYSPERTIQLCHKCHWRAHFQPIFLTEKHKEKLLRVRHGFGTTITEDMIRAYIGPGRRPAQLAVKKEHREKIEKENMKRKQIRFAAGKRMNTLRV